MTDPAGGRAATSVTPGSCAPKPDSSGTHATSNRTRGVTAAAWREKMGVRPWGESHGLPFRPI